MGHTAEDVITYAARVSTPDHQTRFETADKLLAYCIREGHWSVFETASLTVEITTSRAIADQLLRHRTFTFQMASQRYAQCTERTTTEARRQDTKNRQNSFDDLDEETKGWFIDAQDRVWELALELYTRAIQRGIAKECARFMLPMAAQTRMYMTGSFRSWYHYCQLRVSNGTQAEHADIARAVRDEICVHYPKISKAFQWS